MRINKKNLALWGVYDFSNSLIQANLLLYLSQWLIVDNGVPEIYYSLLFSVATILLVISSPFVGVYANRLTRRLPILLLLTLIIGSSYLAMSMFAVLPGVPRTISIPIIIALGMVINFLYQTSLIFYNGLIPSLGSKKDIGKISGFGEFFNSAGMAAGILIALPFVEGKFHFFGNPGKAQSFLPVGIVFIALTVPFFLLFKEKKSGLHTKEVNAKYLISRTKSLIKGLPAFPSMMWFLVGYYFIADAVRTTFLFFPLYLDKVWGLAEREKGMLTIGLIVTMMFGALLMGNLSDRVGVRKTLVAVVFAIAVVLVAATLFPTFGVGAMIVEGIAGILFGGYFAVSRSMLVRLSPRNQLSEYLGLYTLFERAASVVAPLIWSVTIALAHARGPSSSYRLATLVTAAIVFVGWGFLLKVKEARWCC